MQAHQLPIEMRDIHQQPPWRQELLAGGGKTQVPCLRIGRPAGEVQWLYESMDIINYLARQFSVRPL